MIQIFQRLRMFFPINTLLASIGMVSIARALGILTGFGREVSIAAFFGAGAETDAYLIAFLIPNQVELLLVTGILASSFVPVLTEIIHNNSNDQEVPNLIGTIGSITIIVTGVVSLLGVLFAPQIVSALVPGYSQETQTLTISLMRFLFPTLILIGLSGFFESVLNAYEYFAIPAVASAVFNVVIIAGILLGASRLGAWGLALATAVAVICQWLMELAAMRYSKIPYRMALNLRHPAIPGLFRLALPIFVQVLVVQVYLAGERYLASMLVEGSVTAINYARTIAMAPPSVLGLSISIVLFPTLSRQVAKQDFAAFESTLLRWVSRGWLLMAPIMAFTIVLAKPIVILIFQRGAFDLHATQLTSSAFMFYSSGLLFYPAVYLLTRGYYSQKRSLTPLVITTVTSIFSLIFASLVMKYLGIGAIALAQAILALSQMTAYLWFLRIQERRIPFTSLIRMAGTTILAALIAAIACKICWSWLAEFAATNFLSNLASLAISGIATLFVYFTILIALRCEDALLLVSRFRRLEV